MTIEERVQHLANITFLLDYHTKLGSGGSRWVIHEWTYHNEALMKQLKEAYDEAGNRKNDKRSDTADTTNITGHNTGVRGPDRASNLEH